MAAVTSRFARFFPRPGFSSRLQVHRHFMIHVAATVPKMRVEWLRSCSLVRTSRDDRGACFLKLRQRGNHFLETNEGFGSCPHWLRCSFEPSPTVPLASPVADSGLSWNLFSSTANRGPVHFLCGLQLSLLRHPFSPRSASFVQACADCRLLLIVRSSNDLLVRLSPVQRGGKKVIDEGKKGSSSTCNLPRDWFGSCLASRSEGRVTARPRPALFLFGCSRTFFIRARELRT